MDQGWNRFCLIASHAEETLNEVIFWAKDPEANIPPGGHFYFPIQSLLVISQEQLKKHKQSFNSLLPEGPSSEFGLVHTHSY